MSFAVPDFLSPMLNFAGFLPYICGSKPESSHDSQIN